MKNHFNLRNMNSVLQRDLNDIENILEKAKQQGIGFLNNLETIPTSNKNSIDYTRGLNELGLGSCLLYTSPSPRD